MEREPSLTEIINENGRQSIHQWGPSTKISRTTLDLPDGWIKTADPGIKQILLHQRGKRSRRRIH
jgi:hypothetical protein